ncbi:FtsB family cell division protein [Eubacterium coprostanoligenes]|uniref:FtsB family cell division protein n=1 Tax=Eubacterium coprostanoligenes TaxID=290054 RepID=UPI0023528E38|nr:septum formation initiator family protein [Eubacterium coprostanoligenes]MCI6354179.1 septum formation initiator family protein [Eubacterium coprostanoligenes]
MKAKSNKIKSKKNVVIGFIVAIIVALVGYCSFCLITNAADISRLKTESQELNTKYQQQLDENKKVKSILNSDDKDEYIEQKAREKGYVKDGEVVYYDISSSK